MLQRLAAFLIALSVILLAFAQMLYLVYMDTYLCDQVEPFDPDYSGCVFPHCTFQGSFLKVYTMMMGNINGVGRYSTNLTAQIMFVGYAFIVIIILSNVLIAIVTDSYEVIQNDRAAIVFWSNRLDFVAEMDVITYAFQRRLGCLKSHEVHVGGDNNSNKKKMGPETAPSNEFDRDDQQQLAASTVPPSTNESTDFSTDAAAASDLDEPTEWFREAWHQVMLLFDANLYEDIDWIEVWVYNVFRIFSIFVVVPLWLIVGVVSAGWLWPPQIREWLFVQKETETSRAELERAKLLQLKSIQTDLKGLKQEFLREMANGRDEMIRMKAEVETVQGDVFADLQQIKELMGTLLAA